MIDHKDILHLIKHCTKRDIDFELYDYNNKSRSVMYGDCSLDLLKYASGFYLMFKCYNQFYYNNNFCLRIYFSNEDNIGETRIDKKYLYCCMPNNKVLLNNDEYDYNEESDFAIQTLIDNDRYQYYALCKSLSTEGIKNTISLSNLNAGNFGIEQLCKLYDNLTAEHGK